jgi:hypothetical protein
MRPESRNNLLLGKGSLTHVSVTTNRKNRLLGNGPLTHVSVTTNRKNRLLGNGLETRSRSNENVGK